MAGGAVQQAAAQQRQAAAASLGAGFGGTLTSSPQGAATPQVASKQLLGQ